MYRGWPPSQGWRTFLNNHVDGIAAIDLFVLPTITFRLLYCLVILRHGRRLWVSFGVTTNPTAEWISRQITETFPWDSAPRYLIRDRDTAYGSVFRQRLRAMGIRDKPTAPRSPWQNPYIERLIGTIRRECLDHMIVFGEAHLRRILGKYAVYYNKSRVHCSLDKDAPLHRAIERVGVICPGKRLGDLSRQPLGRRVSCHLEPQQVAAGRDPAPKTRTIDPKSGSAAQIVKKSMTNIVSK